MQHIINYEKRKLKMVINKENDIIKDDYKLLHGDCVQRIKEIESDSVGFSVFSPPFASLYTYSDSIEDMGNSKDYDDFFVHFKYLIDEILRITKTGRLVSVHCMNLPTTITHHGYIGIQDFRGDVIRAFQDSGFIYHSEVAIWKDPVVAMQRTKSIGLLHKQLVKDSCKSRQGIPDYVCTFRKDGANDDPVAGELDYFSGDHNTFKNTGNLSIDIWQRYASPIWTDINQSDTLQYISAREHEDERHICPLQLEVIERCMQLWSKENDIVFTPFMGIGSEVYQALKMNRKAIGIELKKSYFDQAVKNIESVVEEKKQAVLF